MIVKCSNCGKECEHFWAVGYATGSSKQWLCWDCYKEGQKEATQQEMTRKKRMNKIFKK